MDAAKEIVGFLCRWALLAVAAVVTVLVAAAAVIGAAAVAGRPQPDVVLSDELWQAWRVPYVVGRAVPQTEERPFSELLSRPPGGVVESADVQSGVLLAAVSGVGEGLHQSAVAGLPYGRYAFCEDRSRCLVLPPGRRVVAMDTLLADLGGADVTAMVERIARDRAVVLFHPGPVDSLEDYRALRDRMVERFPQQLLIFPAKGTFPVLKHLAGTLDENLKVKPAVVTPDVALARKTASWGFETYWLVPQGATEEAGGTVRRYDSPAALAEALTQD